MTQNNRRFPFSPYRSISVLCLILITFFLTFPASGASRQIEPAREQSRQCIDIINILEDAHYLKKTLDNRMSSQIFEQYLKRLDPRKHFFTQADISSFKRYEFSLDDELKNGRLDLVYRLFNLYLNRAIDRTEYILSLIPTWESDFNFDLDDQLIINEKALQWQLNQAALKMLWRKEFKNHIITIMLDEKNPESISSTLDKLYTNRLAWIRQTDSNDVFQIFMNTVAAMFDPHTQYLPPRASEDFDIHMSLSLEGIGAVLQTEYEYTKVVRLIPKGPADLSALLMPGDKIIGVGQGMDGEIVDTLGQRIDRVVKLIRGPKNTYVRLKIIPAKKSVSTKTIQIKRDRVKLEDQSAKKEVIKLTHNDRNFTVGIIEIPTFYIDFQAYHRGDPNYKSTTKDVQKLLDQLKQENIDGLIIDLRDNGGGALQEANQLTGLFLKQGPTVQVRNKHTIARLSDTDPSISYTGPLVVMINRMSASASEIFAGAIKDYHRGIIIGSRSFGKGTVQELRELGDARLKLTRGKFYRVSGESTQHLGILPDIPFPKIYNTEDTGESSLEGALTWDTTVRAFYSAYPSLEPLISEMKTSYSKRAATDPGIHYLTQRMALMNDLSQEQPLSLNLKVREQQKDNALQKERTLENEYRQAVGKPVLAQEDEEENLFELKDLKEILMNQAHIVTADFIALSKKHRMSW